MKLVNRAEFLKIQEPIVFQKYSSLGNLGELCIKTYSISNVDFECISLTEGEIRTETQEASNSEEFIQLWRNIENDKIREFKRDYNVSTRDGLFDENQMFIIYSREDILDLIVALLTYKGE